MTDQRDEEHPAVPANPQGTPPAAERDEPVLPTASRDDSDEGWGEDAGGRDAEWYRRERPPHHE